VASQKDLLEDGVEVLGLDSIARKLEREWEDEESKWKHGSGNKGGKHAARHATTVAPHLAPTSSTTSSSTATIMTAGGSSSTSTSSSINN
jgi:hypothetical protein